MEDPQGNNLGVFENDMKKNSTTYLDEKIG